MELRHLRYFTTVADTCHFGQAAERLHIAQPALSQAVRQLERELGVVLLHRTTRRVSLTPAGEFLRAEATRLLDSLAATVDGVRQIGSGQHGLVRLGLTGTATFSHLPGVARAIREHLPEVALTVDTDLLTPDQVERLVDGTLDLGILRPPISSDDVELIHMGSEPLVLVVARDHRLAVEPVISMSDLRHESFVGYASRNSAVDDAVLRSCHAAGFTPRRDHLAPGTAALLALVAAGLGVAVLPASASALALDNLLFRDLVDGGSVELSIARSTNSTNPAVDAVIEVLRAAGLIPDHDGRQPEPSQVSMMAATTRATAAGASGRPATSVR